MNESDIQLWHGDCLVEMDRIADQSIDAIIADNPYGTTQCKWDSIIPLDELWRQYKRVIKPRGAIVLNAAARFKFTLYNSNPKWYKYEWIWNKVTAGGLLAKYRPIIQHESVLVFCKKSPNYYPIMTKRDKPIRQKIRQSSNSAPIKYNDGQWRVYTHVNPKTILTFQNRNGGGKLHPTQKPLALLEYLIRTYTNPNDLILDNCMSSGTTLHAAILTDRRAIGIEKDRTYYDIAVARIEKAQTTARQLELPT